MPVRVLDEITTIDDEFVPPCEDDAVIHRALAAVTDVLATTPHVMFCIKGVDGTYLAANQAFADRAGVAAPGDVVGKSAGDLFPADLVERYSAQDDEVMVTGRTLSNELEVITRPDGSYGWFLTSKSRWLDDDGRPAGIVIVSIDQRTAVDGTAPHPRLAAAVDMARTRFAEQLTVGEMAAAAQMTVTQLERTARRVLGLSPKQLILRFRLEAALRLLVDTDDSIAEIAHRCGYYDQSAFSRHFRRVVGVAPAAYRATR
jgi:PAS domain S-box-containing protein